LRCGRRLLAAERRAPDEDLATRACGRPPLVTLSAVLIRDVTSTLAEFDASLRQAAAGRIEGAAPTYRVTDGEVRLDIGVEPGPERRIALIRLPTLRVTFRFDGGTRAAQDALLARLDRAMHRGGG
jgi:hypothetical protein